MRVEHIRGTTGRLRKDGWPRRVDGEPFFEITVDTDDGESLSFLVAYADKDRAEEVIVLGSEYRRRNEVAAAIPVCGATCNSNLACSDREQ